MRSRIFLALLLPGMMVFASRSIFAADSLATQVKKLTEQEKKLTEQVNELINETKALRKTIADLEKRLAEVEKKSSQPPASPFGQAPPFPGFTGGANMAKLAGIKLPPDPSKEDCRRYVEEIQEASRGQNCYGSTDPQLQMLRSVPQEHVDVLIEAVGSPGPGSSNYYIIEALKSLVLRSDIPLLQEHLSFRRELVSVVLEKGWAKEFSDILVRELESGDVYLPTDWPKAVAQLRQSSTYPKLIHYMLNGGNPHMTLEAIESIPDFPRPMLAKGIANLWEKKKLGDDRIPFHGANDFEKGYVAKAAARFGHVDALGYCIRELNKAPTEPFGNDQDLRTVVLKLVPVQMSNEDLMSWFETNESKLSFDEKMMKYRVG